MRPQVVSVTGPGSSDPVIIERVGQPTNVGIACVVTGTVTDYNVEHTFDDVNSVGVAGATWFEHDTMNTLAADADGNYAFPPRWMRVTIVAGTGTVTMTVIQSSYGT